MKRIAILFLGLLSSFLAKTQNFSVEEVTPLEYRAVRSVINDRGQLTLESFNSDTWILSNASFTIVLDTLTLTANWGNHSSPVISADAEGNILLAAPVEGTLQFGKFGTIVNTGTSVMLVKFNWKSGIKWVKAWPYTSRVDIIDISENSTPTLVSLSVYDAIEVDGKEVTGDGSHANAPSILVTRLNKHGDVSQMVEGKCNNNGEAHLGNAVLDSEKSIIFSAIVNGEFQVGGKKVSFNKWDYMVTKVDSTGSTEWMRHIDHQSSPRNEGIRVITDKNDEIYVAGVFENDLTLDGILLPKTGFFFDDVFLARLDASGRSIWARSFSSTSESGFVYSYIDLNDEPVVIVSYADDLTFDEGNTTIDALRTKVTPDRCAVAIGHNRSGQLLEINRLSTYEGIAFFSAAKRDSLLLLTGQSDENIITDVDTIRNKSYSWALTNALTKARSSSIFEEKNTCDWDGYSNPYGNNFNIVSANGNYSVVLSDIQGNKIRSWNHCEMDLYQATLGLTTGIYVITLSNQTSRYSTKIFKP